MTSKSVNNQLSALDNHNQTNCNVFSLFLIIMFLASVSAVHTAVKIATDVDLPTFDQKKLLVDETLRNRYGKIIEGTHYGISYHNVKAQSVTDKLMSFIKPEFRSLFRFYVMAINNYDIYPHTDSYIQVSLNFYIKTWGCNTTFYEAPVDDADVALKKLPEQTDGKLYNRSKLVVSDRIEAKPNEVWLLNTKQIHSVECDPAKMGQNYRTAFVLQSELSFEEAGNAIVNFPQDSVVGGHLEF